MGLAVLLAGLALFIGGHLFTTMRQSRAAVVARMGSRQYQIVYSLVAAAGIALIAYGFGLYRGKGWIDVWYPSEAHRHAALWLMLPALILIVASYIRGTIYRTLRHPMMIGTVVFAIAHLLANGDLGSIVLFGALLAWALADLWTLRRRTDPGAPPMPVGGINNDLIAVVVGAIVYLALALVFPPIVIGVSVFGG